MEQARQPLKKLNVFARIPRKRAGKAMFGLRRLAAPVVEEMERARNGPLD
jgi:hypothetical protein